MSTSSTEKPHAAQSTDAHAIDKTVEIGALIAGKYRVDSLLGEGGMGRVYRAFHVLLEREVALKLLRPEFSLNEDSRERFLAEARAANTVRHPHVVDVLDVGIDAGVPFIVQEFLAGESLARRLELARRLSIIDAVDVLIPIAAALAHAHKQGILHRDIKPENIFLTEANGGVVPKLVDFGIAQSLREDKSDDDIIAGTPAYMAPELVLDSTTRDPRSDVWSMGVVLYECLSGSLPFSAETPSEVFKAICNESPQPLLSLRSDVPPALVALVDRCLARQLDARMPDAKTLLKSLEQLRTQLDGESSSRVRWQSTLAPGTLRVRPRTKTGTNHRPPELVTTSDEAAVPLPTAPDLRQSSVPPVNAQLVAPSEPPATTLSGRSSKQMPKGATLALALALAMVAIVPLLLSQRRRIDAQPDHTSVTRDQTTVAIGPAHAASAASGPNEPEHDPRPTPATGATTTPVIVRAQPVSDPIAESNDASLTGQTAADPQARDHATERPTPRQRPIRRLRDSRDPSSTGNANRPTPAVNPTPLIQLRDER